ncbi:MAG: ABC transporter permease [Clostridia bacterium]|nr:ABC transporter permease [Clostridia bacterium]
MDFTSLLNQLPGAVAQGLIWGIMAIGVYITYRVLDIADLTVDGTMATGGAVCVMLLINGYSMPIAILGAVIAGMLAGMITGLLHTLLGIPAILAGILTQLSLYSVNLKILGSGNQTINTRKYDVLVSMGELRGVPFYQNPIFVTAIFVIALICVLYWFFGTAMGSALRATGNNPNMSRAQGINTNRMKVFGLMISNGIVALAGALLAQYDGQADVQKGRGAIVIGLAAVIIGEVLLSKLLKNFALRLSAVVVGGIVYYIVYQTVIWLGLDADLLKLLSAAVVAIFLGLPYLKRQLLRPSIKSIAQHEEGETNA